MVFDGDCGFCRYWVERWRGATGDRVDYEPSQKVGDLYPEIPAEAFQRAVQFIEPDGRVTSGADAVFRALEYAPRKSWLLDCFREIPGFDALARLVYRVVAHNRVFFSFFTRLFFSRAENAPTYFVARWVFMRLLGIIYLVAFVSLMTQITGLSGKNGLMPATAVLDYFKENHQDGWLYAQVPTLCWFDASDGFLKFMCIAGAALSCCVILDFFPSLCLFLLWALYLSLAQVCQPFLNFQWDYLLLETGFLAIFLVPPVFRPGWRSESGAPRVARWLLLWLLFCLMFESGVVKLSSGDECWRDLTALTYHYQTQPLPIWTSWYMNQEPLWFEKLSMIFMFTVELIVPFCIFGPRMVRRTGCAVLVALQLFIAATGNYCFFNLLTIALCLLLLDDDAWPRWCRAKLPRRSRESDGGFLWLLAVAPVVAADLFMSALQLPQAFSKFPLDRPEAVRKVEAAMAPFGVFNEYGLFRVMTRTRPEIIIEGSNDGKNWLPYEFKWKPGDVNRRPGLVAPFQPRLDWQMWFAAPGDYRENQWFQVLLVRLLQGTPEVLDLMGSNPFPEAPPRYIRGVLYDYQFTRFDDHTRAWWKREYLRPYSPIYSLRAQTEEGN